MQGMVGAGSTQVSEYRWLPVDGAVGVCVPRRPRREGDRAQLGQLSFLQEVVLSRLPHSVMKRLLEIRRDGYGTPIADHCLVELAQTPMDVSEPHPGICTRGEESSRMLRHPERILAPTLLGQELRRNAKIYFIDGI